MFLAVNVMPMNQQYILNKRALNRNTHKIKFHIDWLMKMLSPEACWNLILYFPRRNDLELANSLFAVTYRT